MEQLDLLLDKINQLEKRLSYFQKTYKTKINEIESSISDLNSN